MDQLLTAVAQCGPDYVVAAVEHVAARFKVTVFCRTCVRRYCGHSCFCGIYYYRCGQAGLIGTNQVHKTSLMESKEKNEVVRFCIFQNSRFNYGWTPISFQLLIS